MESQSFRLSLVSNERQKIMFGISAEHLLILGIVLLIFGPRRLPELGNTLGKAIRNFKDSVSGVEEASFRKLGDAPADTRRPADKLEHQQTQAAQSQSAGVPPQNVATADPAGVATKSTPMNSPASENVTTQQPPSTPA